MKSKKKRSSTNAHIETDQTSGNQFFRYLRDLFQKREYAKALETIDRRLAHETDPVEQSRLLSLVGDSEVRRGRFNEAVPIFNRAAQLAQADARVWLRPRLGLVRALLKNVQVQEAWAETEKILQTASQREQDFEQIVSQAGQQIVSQNNNVTIPEKPFRVSVVATQLGRQFLQEGESEKASELFNRAQETNNDGSSRARQFSGLIALRSNNPQGAFEQSRAAILLGKFQSKTVASWPIYLTARHQLGQSGVEAELLEGLRQASLVSPFSSLVTARAVLVIVRTLRGQNNEQWKEIASEWLNQWSQNKNQLPEIAADLRKIQLADLKGSTDTQARLSQAQKLLEVPKLTGIEWLQAAKEIVTQSAKLQQPVNVQGLLDQAMSVFKPQWLGRLRHGLALACIEAGNQEEARSLLQQNIQQLSNDNSEVWGRSLWRLAKIETQQGNAKEAGELYLQFFNSQSALSSPEKLRFYALIEAARSFLMAQDQTAIVGLKEPLNAVVEQISDYELLLDLARQLIQAPPELNGLLQRFLTRGKELAKKQLEETTNPSVAATILFRLARRLNDFADHNAIVGTWKGLSETKRDWLWQEKEEFWQYLAYVYQSYWETGQSFEGESFLKKYLDDSATPADGKVILSVVQAVRQIQQGQTNLALKNFQKAVDLQPTHESNAISFYWLALAQYKQGHSQDAKKQLQQVEKILGSNASLAWKARIIEKSQALRQWIEGAVNEKPSIINSDWTRLN